MYWLYTVRFYDDVTDGISIVYIKYICIYVHVSHTSERRTDISF